MIAWIKRYSSWLPLYALLFLVIIRTGLYIFNSAIANDQQQATENAIRSDLPCPRFCDGFLVCAAEALQKTEVSEAEREYLQRACIAGCQKQAAIVENCQNFVIQKQCTQAALCLQAALQGRPME
ncbi:MAG: Cys-rich protein [Leptospiraceae bacterium]|nr:Cys-rich protein [Leptospiraceae bacterium]